MSLPVNADASGSAAGVGASLLAANVAVSLDAMSEQRQVQREPRTLTFSVRKLGANQSIERNLHRFKLFSASPGINIGSKPVRRVIVRAYAKD